MNILDLKRALRPMSGFYGYNGDGGGGEGASNGPPGPSGGGFSSGGFSSGGSYGGYTTGSSTNIGAAPGNVGGYSPGYSGGGSGLGTGLFGQDDQSSPLNYAPTAVNAPDDNPTYGYKPAQVSKINLGMPNTNLATLKEAVKPFGWLTAIPGIAQIATVAGFVAAVADVATPPQMATFRSATGFSEGDVSEAKSAVASGDEAGFSPKGPGFTNPSTNGNQRVGYNDPTMKGDGSGTKSIADLAAGAVNLQDPTTLATTIANDSWKQWNTDKAALQGQLDTATGRGNALYDTSMAAANDQLGLSRQMNSDYNSIYRPAQAQQAAYVNRLGTQGYRDQVRGTAMAEVQQQSDQQFGIAKRNQQRQGVNPNSGRSLAMGNQNAIQTAAAKVGAAATAERGAYADWAAGLNTMNTNGLALQKQSLANSDSAANWSKMGLAAGSSGMGLGMDLSKLGIGAAAGAGTTAASAAGATNAANVAANNASQNSFGSTVSGALLGVAGKTATNYLTDYFKPSTTAASSTYDDSAYVW